MTAKDYIKKALKIKNSSFVGDEKVIRYFKKAINELKKEKPIDYLNMHVCLMGIAESSYSSEERKYYIKAEKNAMEGYEKIKEPALLAYYAESVLAKYDGDFRSHVFFGYNVESLKNTSDVQKEILETLKTVDKGVIESEKLGKNGEGALMISLTVKGLILERLGQFNSACDCYERVINLVKSPDETVEKYFLTAFLRYSVILSVKGEYKPIIEKINNYKKALIHAGLTDHKAYLDIALIYYLVSRAAKSAGDFDEYFMYDKLHEYFVHHFHKYRDPNGYRYVYERAEDKSMYCEPLPKKEIKNIKKLVEEESENDHEYFNYMLTLAEKLEIFSLLFTKEKEFDMAALCLDAAKKVDDIAVLTDDLIGSSMRSSVAKKYISIAKVYKLKYEHSKKIADKKALKNIIEQVIINYDNAISEFDDYIGDYRYATYIDTDELNEDAANAEYELGKFLVSVNQLAKGEKRFNFAISRLLETFSYYPEKLYGTVELFRDFGDALIRSGKKKDAEKKYIAGLSVCLCIAEKFDYIVDFPENIDGLKDIVDGGGNTDYGVMSNWDFDDMVETAITVCDRLKKLYSDKDKLDKVEKLKLRLESYLPDYYGEYEESSEG